MQVWGHRGASGYAPENTLEAFALAYGQGADGVELDVHLTRDGVPVVIHDAAIDRVSNGSGAVADFTLAELRQFTFNKTAPQFACPRIPTLAEVYALLQPTALTVNVELKAKGVEPLVLDLAARCHMGERVLYSSFDHYAVLRVKELCSTARAAFLFVGNNVVGMAEYVRGHGGCARHPSADLVTPELIAHCHECGLAVNVWNVRDDDVRRCLDWGADAVISNFPDRTRAIIDSHEVARHA